MRNGRPLNGSVPAPYPPPPSTPSQRPVREAEVDHLVAATAGRLPLHLPLAHGPRVFTSENYGANAWHLPRRIPQQQVNTSRPPLDQFVGQTAWRGHSSAKIINIFSSRALEIVGDVGDARLLDRLGVRRLHLSTADDGWMMNFPTCQCRVFLFLLLPLAFPRVECDYFDECVLSFRTFWSLGSLCCGSSRLFDRWRIGRGTGLCCRPLGHPRDEEAHRGVPNDFIFWQPIAFLCLAFIATLENKSRAVIHLFINIYLSFPRNPIGVRTTWK